MSIQTNEDLQKYMEFSGEASAFRFSCVIERLAEVADHFNKVGLTEEDPSRPGRKSKHA